MTQGIEYHFRVTQLEGGQRRKYGDSYYHYEVEDLGSEESSPQIMKNFCTGFVFPSKDKVSYKKDAEKYFSAHFESYWTHFEKIDERKWMFKGVSPSTH